MYMAVTTDKYELPIAIGDTAGELGKIVGVSPNTIHSSISKNLSGKTRKMRFVKVKIDDEELEELYG